AIGFESRFAVETNQSDLVIVVAELYWFIAGAERDASVVQVTRGGAAGRDCDATPFAFVRLRHKTRFARDRVLAHENSLTMFNFVLLLGVRLLSSDCRCRRNFVP